MAERLVKVESMVGLHSRPAAEFVRAAAQCPVEVSVGRYTGELVNAKSILAVLALDARPGEHLRLRAEGEGAEEVLDRLAGLFAQFSETNA